MALINYPASVTTDREKLTAIYALEEKLRLEGNAKGAEYSDKLATLKNAWYEYADRPVTRGGSIYWNAVDPIYQERARLRDAIRRSQMTDAEWIKWNQENPFDDTLVKQLFGDRHVEKLEASTVGADALDMLKGIRLADIDGEPPPDPLEDFTTYTEVDPDSAITITDANTITVVDLLNDSVAYVRKVGFTIGNFEHLLKCIYTNSGAGQPIGYHVVCTVSTDITGLIANQDGPCMCGYEGTNTYYSKDWGTGNSDQSAAGNPGVGDQCWPKVKRSAGTAYQVVFYSNAERSAWYDVFNYVCQATTMTMFYALMSRNSALGTDNDCVLEDYDLQGDIVNIPAAGDDSNAAALVNQGLI